MLVSVRLVFFFTANCSTAKNPRTYLNVATLMGLGGCMTESCLVSVLQNDVTILVYGAYRNIPCNYIIRIMNNATLISMEEVGEHYFRLPANPTSDELDYSM